MNTKEIHDTVENYIINKILPFRNEIIDIAFLGSFSGHYGWKSTRFGDCDLWIFSKNLRSKELWVEIREFVLGLVEEINQKYSDLEVSFNVINGPYKPPVYSLEQEHLFIHLNVDDEETYSEHSEFTKFSWSKYKCYSKPEILLELYQKTGDKTKMNILTSKYGVMDTLNILNMKELRVHFYDVFSGCKDESCFKMGSAEYNEYLLYAAMTNARNIGRLNGWKQADYLPNREFVDMFCAYSSNHLLEEIYSVKSEVENRGYRIINSNELSKLVWNFMKYLQQI